MMRVRTVAAALGIVAGVWALWGSYFGQIGKEACQNVSCLGTAPPNPFIVGLAVLLVINSLVGLIGPSRVFYVLAALSILLSGAVIPTSALGDTGVEVALVLSLATFALSLVAARRVSAVSEQAHPMNLPVFG